MRIQKFFILLAALACVGMVSAHAQEGETPLPVLPEEQPAVVELPAADAAEAADVPTIPEPPVPAADVSAFPLPEESTATVRYNVALLQGLNKVTTKISPVESPVGTVARFGNLEIIARACWKSPPEEQPESAALLDIWELKPDEAPKRIFLGWMFASSPGISSLEHPVYDITVLDCGGLAAVPE